MSDRLSFANFFGKSGDIAAVSPDDLRNVWLMMRDVKEGTSIDVRAYESACGGGADVMAVCYRASMLGLLQMVVPGKLVNLWLHDGELDDAVFQVAATFPMKNMEVGVVQNGPPFDVEEFLKQIGERT
jgi:hypothetical protein